MAILDLTKILNLALRARFNILVRSNMAYINFGLFSYNPHICNSEQTLFNIAIFLFGAATFPIFSLSAAHANDFCNENDMAELNSSLIFTYALGAIISPFLSGSLITLLGPRSMFILIGLSHMLLIIYGIYRMGIRPTLSEKTPYTYLPRTSAIISWFIKHENSEK